MTRRSISVRMYNVGFGDCFLLRIPTDDGKRRMLVDCGYHSQGRGSFNDRQLVEQIKLDLDGEQLDVVVATHRHQDHISGFGETELWRGVGVQEVWLPFTANPALATDPSLAVWNRALTMVHSLFDPGGNLAPHTIAALASGTPEERAAAQFMLWNARANAPGIENLTRGMRRADGRQSKRRYLPEDGNDVPSRFTTPSLPGVTVHVLGPSRDPKFRGKKKVPASWGLAVDPADPGAAAPTESPFGTEWRVPVHEVPIDGPFKHTALQTIRLFNEDLFAAANALDGFLNGESLVLVLEVGRARLLLPGDAEVSSWQKILSDPEALELAGSATFLKVGHHGSHNATPLVFLKEHLGEGTPAMMSTQEGPGRYRNGIPLEELLTTLSDRSMPLARSDVPPDDAGETFTQDAEGRWTDCKIPC